MGPDAGGDGDPDGEAPAASWAWPRRRVELSRLPDAASRTITRIGDSNHQNIFENDSREKFQELARKFEVERVGETDGKIRFRCSELDDTIFGDQWSDDREVFLAKKERKRMGKGTGSSDKVKFFRAQLRRRAFVEVFSPPRIAHYSDHAGVVCLGSFDKEGGWDFLKGEDRHKFRELLRKEKPWMVILEPPL